jgi:3-deoxy-7-phosphoheptulonate synthase
MLPLSGRSEKPLPGITAVDCSHANSLKNPRLQSAVFQYCAHQIQRGNRCIVGVMNESFLEEGNQPIPADLSTLRYGCSVTDACIGWEDAVTMFRETRNQLKEALPKR